MKKPNERRQDLTATFCKSRFVKSFLVIWLIILFLSKWLGSTVAPSLDDVRLAVYALAHPSILDEDNFTWFALNRILLFDKAIGKWHAFGPKEGVKSYSGARESREMHKFKNTLWIRVGWTYQLFIFKYTNQELKLVPKPDFTIVAMDCGFYSSEVWCWADTGTGRLKLKKFADFKWTEFNEVQPLAGNGEYYRPLMVVDQQNIWSIQVKDLFVIDKKSKQSTLVFSSEYKLLNILDDERFVWLSDQNNIYKVNKLSKKYTKLNIGDQSSSNIFLRKVTRNSIWVELWSGAFMGIGRLNKQNGKFQSYVMNLPYSAYNTDFFNKIPLAVNDFVFLPLDIDENDNVWISKVQTDITEYLSHKTFSRVQLVSLVHLDANGNSQEFTIKLPNGTLIENICSIMLRNKHSELQSRMAMKATKDGVWILTLNAILKFDPKSKKWFYREAQ